MAERFQGVAEQCQGAAERCRRAAERVQGAAERIQGVAAQFQGVAARFQRAAERFQGAAETIPEGSSRVFPRSSGVPGGARNTQGPLSTKSLLQIKPRGNRKDSWVFLAPAPLLAPPGSPSCNGSAWVPSIRLAPPGSSWLLLGSSLLPWPDMAATGSAWRQEESLGGQEQAREAKRSPGRARRGRRSLGGTSALHLFLSGDRVRSDQQRPQSADRLA